MQINDFSLIELSEVIFYSNFRLIDSGAQYIGKGSAYIANYISTGKLIAPKSSGTFLSWSQTIHDSVYNIRCQNVLST